MGNSDISKKMTIGCILTHMDQSQAVTANSNAGAYPQQNPGKGVAYDVPRRWPLNYGECRKLHYRSSRSSAGVAILSDEQRVKKAKDEQARASNARKAKLNELIDFSQSFHLGTPVPDDIMPVLSKRARFAIHIQDSMKAKGMCLSPGNSLENPWNLTENKNEQTTANEEKPASGLKTQGNPVDFQTHKPETTMLPGAASGVSLKHADPGDSPARWMAPAHRAPGSKGDVESCL